MVDPKKNAEVLYFTVSRRLYPEKPWRRYLELMFKDVPLVGGTVLDIGGGNGAISFYTASKGADAVCLEPAGDGSNPHMRDDFNVYYSELGPVLTVQVDLVEDSFQNLDPEAARYDVVVINNAINHFDEGACQRLLEDQTARARYLQMFRKLADLTISGGYLIVADCARENFWNRIGRRSPFAPSIEWLIHQQPEVWVGLLEEAGFDDGRVRWNTHAKLGAVGQALLGNRLGGYLTNSHFILTMRQRQTAA